MLVMVMVMVMVMVSRAGIFLVKATGTLFAWNDDRDVRRGVEGLEEFRAKIVKPRPVSRDQ